MSRTESEDHLRKFSADLHREFAPISRDARLVEEGRAREVLRGFFDVDRGFDDMSTPERRGAVDRLLRPERGAGR
jgi:hypothetical protein